MNVKKLNFNNRWVLITGASSGLGYETAFQMARLHQANLILSARRAEILYEMKSQIESETGVKVKVVLADLSINEDNDQLIHESLNGQELYAAILNAGITYFGEHLALSEAEFDRLLQTNVKSVVKLTTAFVKHFENNKKEGGVMVVSSMAALYPVPYQAVYSGTKAFVLSFANALSLEIKNKAFSLTVYAPGGIETEMTSGESFNALKKWLMPVKQAAKEGIYALQYRKFIHLPGNKNRIGTRFMRLLSRQFIMQKMEKVYSKALHSKNKSS